MGTSQARAISPAPSASGLTLPCRDCGEMKPKGDFNPTGQGHPKRFCRACENARKRERYHADADLRQKLLDYQKDYRPQNRDYLNARNRSYYAANRERVLGNNRRYREEHKDEINARRRAKREAAKRAQADSNG
jgi:hypothetical protein